MTLEEEEEIQAGNFHALIIMNSLSLYACLLLLTKYPSKVQNAKNVGVSNARISTKNVLRRP